MFCGRSRRVHGVAFSIQVASPLLVNVRTAREKELEELKEDMEWNKKRKGRSAEAARTGCKHDTAPRKLNLPAPQGTKTLPKRSQHTPISKNSNLHHSLIGCGIDVHEFQTRLTLTQMWCRFSTGEKYCNEQHGGIINASVRHI